jgi:DNA polymerase I
MPLEGVQLHLVDSFEEVEAFLRWLSADRGREWLAIDLETGGLDWWRQRIRMAQFGDTRDGWAIPYDRWGGLVDEVFQRVSHNGPRFVAHNAKFDSQWLRHNRHKPPPFDDTMAMAYLIEPHKAKGLKAAAVRHVDKRAAGGQQALDRALKQAKWSWDSVPWDFPEYWKYAALDTVLTAALAETLWPRIEAEFKQAYYLQVESDAVLQKMEMLGMRVDIPYCHEQQQRLDARLDELITMFDEQYGIDPLSPAQLVKFFWEQGIEVPLTTDSGAPSVKKQSLEMIDHPLVHLILEARSCQKMSTTYFGNLIEFADHGGILHPNVNPLGAITGRQSITRPALQTLPRTALVRNAFIPRDGHKLLLADFQGQEMRVFAAFCNDPNMRAAYARGEDLHNFTARELYGPNFTKQQRQTTKNAGFSKIYGAGVTKFAATAKISVGEAEKFLAMYDKLFPRARAFQGEVVQKIMERSRESDSDFGYITTLAGRKIPVPRGRAYVGVNYIVQGSCSDILRRTLVDLDNAGLVDLGEDGGLVLPVHDETAFDVSENIVEDVTNEVVKIMEHSAFGISVPMVVETTIVDRWGDKYS